MSILTINTSSIATNIQFADNTIVVALEDGREISIPLERFPKLRDAHKQQLENYRFIGQREGVHWEDLDEDILIQNLLN